MIEAAQAKVADAKPAPAVMEPRDYQSECLEVALCRNTIIVGDTGVGKTLVAMLLMQEYFRTHPRPSINYATGDTTARWTFFLAPTQQLVRQQAERIAAFTGLPTRSYVGKELDAWESSRWRQEFKETDILVITPGAMLNLLHRGHVFLSMENVGLLIIDECHVARKKHPYAQIMCFYDNIPPGEHRPIIFGMTASPTPECARTLRCKEYVCNPEAESVKEHAAVPGTICMKYLAQPPSDAQCAVLDGLLCVAFSDGMFKRPAQVKRDDMNSTLLRSLDEYGLWAATRHLVLVLESMWKTHYVTYRADPARNARVRGLIGFMTRRLTEVAVFTKEDDELLAEAEAEAAQTEPDDSATAELTAALPHLSTADSSSGGSSRADIATVSCAAASSSSASTSSKVPVVNYGLPLRMLSLVTPRLKTLTAQLAASVPSVSELHCDDEAPSDRGPDSSEQRGPGEARHATSSSGSGGGSSATAAAAAAAAKEDSDSDDDDGEPDAAQTAALYADMDNDEADGCGAGTAAASAAAAAADRAAVEGSVHVDPFQCMVFVERRTTARVVCDLLRVVFKLRKGTAAARRRPAFACSFVIGASLAQGRTAVPNEQLSGEQLRDAIAEAAAAQAKEDLMEHHRAAHALRDFRAGRLQLLVTTDACSEGIDVPECNLVISLDPLKHVRHMMHTRGRTRAKSGKFCVLVKEHSDEQNKIDAMLLQAECIRRNDLRGEAISTRRPHREKFPTFVQTFEETGATLDLDVSIALLHEAQQGLGLPFLPHFKFEDMVEFGGGFTCSAHMPAFLQLPTAAETEDEAQDGAGETVLVTSTNKVRAYSGSKKKYTYAGVLAPGFEQNFPFCATKQEAKAVAAFVACCRLHRAGVLDDNLVVAPPVQRLNLNKYAYFDAELVEDHSRVPLPSPGSTDLRVPPILSLTATGGSPFLYEVPQARLSRKFEHEVVPQVFALLLSAELKAATLECLQGRGTPLIPRGQVSLTAEQCSKLVQCHEKLLAVVIHPETVEVTEQQEKEKRGPSPPAADRGYLVVPIQHQEASQSVAIDWTAVGYAVDGGGNDTTDTVLMVSRRTSTKRSRVQRFLMRRKPTALTVDGYLAVLDKLKGGAGGEKSKVVKAALGNVDGYLEKDEKVLGKRLHSEAQAAAQNAAGEPVATELAPFDPATAESTVKLAHWLSAEDLVTHKDAKLHRALKLPEGEIVFREILTESLQAHCPPVETKPHYDTPAAAKAQANSAAAAGDDKVADSSSSDMVIDQPGSSSGNSSNDTGATTAAAAAAASASRSSTDADRGPVKKLRLTASGNSNGNPNGHTGNSPTAAISPSTSAAAAATATAAPATPSTASSASPSNSDTPEATVTSVTDAKPLVPTIKEAPQLLLVPGHDCEPETFPVGLLFGAMYALPTAFVLERVLLCDGLNAAAGLPCPVVDTEAALRRPANERMETLGDAWLKLYMSLVVMQVQPFLMEEGMITTFRSNLISNCRLTKCAIAKGLVMYVHPPRSMVGRPFVHHWVPPLLPTPPTHEVSWKVPADCVEALLGTCLLEAGEAAPQSMLQYLGLPVLKGFSPKDLAATDTAHTAGDNSDAMDVSVTNSVSAQHGSSSNSSNPNGSNLNSSGGSNGFNSDVDSDAATAEVTAGMAKLKVAGVRKDFPAVSFVGDPSEWALKGRPGKNITSLARQLQTLPMGALVSEAYATAVPQIAQVQSLEPLEAALGYTFKCKWLPLQAVTHASHTMLDHGRRWMCETGGEQDADGTRSIEVADYQRLELLGDAVLSYLVVTQLFLHEEYGGQTPHIMTVKTSYCVRNSTLAVVAVQKLKLHRHVRCAPSIAHSIDKFAQDVFSVENPPPKGLADAFEALMAAVYVDCGFDMSVICKVFWPLLEKYARHDLGEVGYEPATQREQPLEAVKSNGAGNDDITIAPATYDKDDMTEFDAADLEASVHLPDQFDLQLAAADTPQKAKGNEKDNGQAAGVFDRSVYHPKILQYLDALEARL